MHIVASSISTSPKVGRYLTVIAALALLFAALCGYALIVESHMLWDTAAGHWVHSQRSAMGDQVMLMITLMADLPVSTAIILGLALLLMIERLWWLAFYLVCLFFSTSLSITIIKFLTQRTRPSLSESTLTLMSFPSGHAARAVLVFGAVALLLSWGRTPQTRKLALSIAGILSLSVAASRVYLGVHWTSDVLAGATLAAVMLVSVDWQLRVHLDHAVPLPVKSVLAAIVVIYLGYYIHNVSAQSPIYGLAIQH